MFFIRHNIEKNKEPAHDLGFLTVLAVPRMKRWRQAWFVQNTLKEENALPWKVQKIALSMLLE